MEKGIEYLRRKLDKKRWRVNVRYKYYEMKNVTRDLGISTPPGLRNWYSVLGWNAKAVDALADRLVFREFADDTFDLNGIYNMNNRDTLFDSAILGSLIGSCDFIYIREDEGGNPVLEVIDGANATGIMDPQTGMLTEGYAVLERDERERPVVEAYFKPHETWVFRDGQEAAELFETIAPYPLLVPIVYRPDAKRPFGHSRISRACMEITASAIRTLKRSEISAEFFSFPQRWVVGTSPHADPLEKWRVTMSSLLEITKDEDGSSNFSGDFALYETLLRIGGYTMLKSNASAAIKFKPAEMVTTRATTLRTIGEVPHIPNSRAYGATLTEQEREALEAAR